MSHKFLEMTLNRICRIYAAKPSVLSSLLTSRAGNSAWGFQLDHLLFTCLCQTNSVLAKVTVSPFISGITDRRRNQNWCYSQNLPAKMLSVRTSSCSLSMLMLECKCLLSLISLFIHSSASCFKCHHLQISVQLSRNCLSVGSILQAGEKE